MHLQATDKRAAAAGSAREALGGNKHAFSVITRAITVCLLGCVRMAELCSWLASWNQLHDAWNGCESACWPHVVFGSTSDCCPALAADTDMVSCNYFVDVLALCSICSCASLQLPKTCQARLWCATTLSTLQCAANSCPSNCQMDLLKAHLFPAHIPRTIHGPP